MVARRRVGATDVRQFVPDHAGLDAVLPHETHQGVDRLPMGPGCVDRHPAIDFFTA